MYNDITENFAIQNFIASLASEAHYYDIPSIKRAFVNAYTSLDGKTYKEGFADFLLSIFNNMNSFFEGDEERNFVEEELANFGKEKIFDFNKFFWTFGFQDGKYYKGETKADVPFYEIGANIERLASQHLPNKKYIFTIRNCGDYSVFLLKFDDREECSAEEGWVSFFADLELFTLSEIKSFDTTTRCMIQIFYQHIIGGDIIGTNFDLYLN